MIMGSLHAYAPIIDALRLAVIMYTTFRLVHGMRTPPWLVALAVPGIIMFPALHAPPGSGMTDAADWASVLCTLVCGLTMIFVSLSKLIDITNRNSVVWRTVATARRISTFEETHYPLHGVIDRRPVDVRYAIHLEQDARGRRRWRLDRNGASVPARAFHGDPLLKAAAAWKRGAAAPAVFQPV